MSGFEYDENKSASNLEKHGIDFIRAQELWLDDELVEVQVNSKDEPRYLVIARIENKYW